MQATFHKTGLTNRANFICLYVKEVCKTIKQCISMFAGEDQKSWSFYLPQLVFAMNNAVKKLLNWAVPAVL